ncbi:MAG: DUF5908 family protein [Gilvibacter sp.]
MPIEIRELVIKTEVRTETAGLSNDQTQQELYELKQQLLDDCKRLISEIKTREKRRR